MTRALLIAPTPFFADRGCHVRIYEQARQLKNRDVPFRLITYPIGDDPPGLDVERVREMVPYKRYEPGPAWTRLLLDAQLLARAWKICRREPPHIIHAYLHEGCLIGAALKLRFGIPLLFDYQGSLTEESIQHGFIPENSLRARIFYLVEHAVEKFADRITVSSAAMAEPLAKKKLPVEVLPDVVDPERFRPGPKDASLAARLGLPRGRPLAVYLGAMSEYQGTDLVLKAASYLKSHNRPAPHFLMMGYPEEIYVKMSRELGVQDRVTFTGRVAYFKAPDFLQLGDLALAPKLARTEANGKVLNYMACGLPVVAFDLPVNRELLGGQAVWVTPSPDRGQASRDLAQAIDTLLSDSVLAERLAQAGRERARLIFQAATLGVRLTDIYNELAGHRATREPLGPGKALKLAFHQVEKARAAIESAAVMADRRVRGANANEREARHWSRRAGRTITTWQDHPLIRQAINRRVTGDPDKNWIDWFAREFGAAGFDRALNLGCGFGDLEDHAFALGLVRSFHSIDLSAAAVAEARRRLAGRPVVFEHKDANDFIPENNQYDIAFAASSLHHFISLDRVLDRVRDGLRPGGLLVFDEFVGPSRFQWTARQLEVINTILAALPPRYRRDLRAGFGVKRRVYPPPQERLSRDSPFEAIRSDEIIPLARERFEILARRDYGGAVLHPLLDRIAGNFKLDSQEDTHLLRRLIKLEDDLIAAGALSSDFTVVVARKRND